MNKLKRVTVYVQKDTHRKFRSRLALLGLSVSGWFRAKMQELLDSE